MPYTLSALSRRRLAGVHPHLVRVVQRAITLTSVDFRVQEGVRSKERQAELVKAGASRTLDSRHITGHAVDLAALVGGKVRWDWPLYYQIAEAIGEAAALEDVMVIWGGCWCSDVVYRGRAAEAVGDYAKRRREAGKTPFLDGPHFELPRD